MSAEELFGVLVVVGMALAALYAVIYFAVRDAIRETRADSWVKPDVGP